MLAGLGLRPNGERPPYCLMEAAHAVEERVFWIDLHELALHLASLLRLDQMALRSLNNVAACSYWPATREVKTRKWM